MKTYVRREEMDDLYHATVRRLMETHAARALAAARLLGHGLQFVPAIAWLKVVAASARDQVDHYETIARLYADVAGEGLEPVVLARVAEWPPEFAGSWVDLALAQFVYGRGMLWQLREHDACSFVPYREVVAGIVRAEAARDEGSARIAVEVCGSGRYDDVKQALFERWLVLGLRAFGRPNTPGNVYAITEGLKKRDLAAVIQDYVRDLAPVVAACGLRFPAPARLGTDLPPGVDLDPAPAAGS